MEWTVETPQFGDIIRVKQQFYYHYGIFVSEDSVIQFGYRNNSNIPPDEICVVSTTISQFSEGEMVETQKLTSKERRTRRTAQDIVKIATSRLGEKGYNILSNNCEHFVNECAFGKKRSFLDDVRKNIREKLKKQ